MKRINIASVVSAKRISPNMIRVRLKSDAVHQFPEAAAGGHLKLIIPEPGASLETFTKFLRSWNVRSRMRTYTIRHLRTDEGTIDVDFVAHGDDGPASAWAISAKAGDFIGISFPGAPKLKPSASGRYLVAVDMTAFPAAAASLERLPENARGDVYAEILSADDIQPLSAPKGLNIHWIVNPANADSSETLISAIRDYLLEGNESVFVAGDFEAVKNLRSYFRDERAYPKDQLYISSYWKRGLVEAEHKRVKAFLGLGGLMLASFKTSEQAQEARPDIAIGHIGLAVRNIQTSTEFFELLGARIVVSRESMAIAELRGGTHIILRAMPSQTDIRAGFDLMVDDIRGTRSKLSKAGYSPSQIMDGGIHSSFIVADKSGIEFEITSSHAMGPV